MGFAEGLNFSASTNGPIVDLISFGPIRRAFTDVIDRMRIHISRNNKFGVADIMGQAPVINEIRRLLFDYDGLNYLIHSLLNPIRIVDQSLFFLQLILNRLSEIGANKEDKSPRELKTIIAMLFVVAYIPVTLVKEMLDIPYQLLYNVLYRPSKFFYHSFAQAWKNDHIENADIASVTEKPIEESNTFDNSHSKIVSIMGNTDHLQESQSTSSEEFVNDNDQPTEDAETADNYSSLSIKQTMFNGDTPLVSPQSSTNNTLRTIFSAGKAL